MVAEYFWTLQMDACEKSQAPFGKVPLSISTGSVDLPEIDLSNVRSNLSKGGMACILFPSSRKEDPFSRLLEGRQHEDCWVCVPPEAGKKGKLQLTVLCSWWRPEPKWRP